MLCRKTKGPPRPRTSSVRSHSGTSVGRRERWSEQEATLLPSSLLLQVRQEVLQLPGPRSKTTRNEQTQTPTKTFPKGCPLSLWHEYHLVERQLLRRPLGATRSDAVGMAPSALSFHTSPRDSGVYASLTISQERQENGYWRGHWSSSTCKGIGKTYLYSVTSHINISEGKWRPSISKKTQGERVTS